MSDKFNLVKVGKMNINNNTDGAFDTEKLQRDIYIKTLIHSDTMFTGLIDGIVSCACAITEMKTGILYDGCQADEDLLVREASMKYAVLVDAWHFLQEKAGIDPFLWEENNGC